MAPKKKVVNFIKLQIPAGAANPAPPVGPALGAAQVNIMQFCQAFNAATKDQAGDIIPVEISVYEDRSFDFVCKTPPAAKLILKELGIKSGSAVPQRDKVGQLTDEQLAASGITPGTIRLSVGIEAVEDILADLEQALAAAR